MEAIFCLTTMNLTLPCIFFLFQLAPLPIFLIFVCFCVVLMLISYQPVLGRASGQLDNYTYGDTMVMMPFDFWFDSASVSNTVSSSLLPFSHSPPPTLLRYRENCFVKMSFFSVSSFLYALIFSPSPPPFFL